MSSYETGTATNLCICISHSVPQSFVLLGSIIYFGITSVIQTAHREPKTFEVYY